MEGGTVTWHGADGDLRATIPELEAHAPSQDDPIHLSARLAFGAVPVSVDGEVGSWSGAQDIDRRTPWPVRLALTAADARATVAGGVTKPMQMRGYSFKLDGAIPDLAALQPFFPGVRMPGLRDVSLAAQLSEGGNGGPQLAALTVRAGPSDLSGYAPGLGVSQLEISMPRVDRPIRASVEGSFAGTPLRLSANVGAPGALLGGYQVAGSMPIDVSAVIGGATFIARGAISDPVRLTGADVAISARVPDLDALSPLAGRTLPPLKAIVFLARLRDRDGGIARGIALRDVKLSSSQGDLAGEAVIGFGAPPSVQGTLTSARLDLDAILAAVSPPAPPPADAAAPAAQRQWIVPDTKLPFDQIRGADADLRFKVTSLLAGGATYRDAAGRLVAKEGKLRLDPLTAQAQGGALNLRLLADTTQPEPAVALAFHAANVPLKTLLGAAGLPDDALGAAEVDLDLRGTGDNPHAIIAGGTGRLGIASVNGRIGGRVLAVLVADPLRRAGLPAARMSGQTDLRCLAARMDVLRGTASVRSFFLDSGEAQLGGSGTIDLGDETVSMIVTPTVRGSGSTGVPLRLSGPIRDPKVSVLGGSDSPERGQALLPRRLIDPDAEACTQPLAIARDGRPGPMPVSLTSLLPPPQPLPPPTSPYLQAAPIPLTPAPRPAPAQAPSGGQQKPIDLFQFMR